MTTTAGVEVCRPAFPHTDHPLLSYGLPFPAAAAKHVQDAFKASRVYIIASTSLAKNTQALIELQASLGARCVGTRVGMKPHTLWSEILQIVNDASERAVDCIITLGAGSYTDGAKIIALALANNVKTWEDLETLNSKTGAHAAELNTPTIPIISIPTSLSGGEYSDFAGGTNDHTKHKVLFAAPTRGPRLIILDPALCATTPDSIWLSTGVRSVDHCVETMCSLMSNDACDAHADAGLRKLVPALLRCKHDNTDLEARLDCQLGGVEAMAAVARGVPMGASHGIGHQLGPLGVGHGETSCIMLPAVCKFNVGVNADRQARVRKLLWEGDVVRKVLETRGLHEGVADLGDMLDAIFRELGMPRSLSEFNVGGQETLDKLAVNSVKDHWCATNPIPLKEKAQVLEILKMVA